MQGIVSKALACLGFALVSFQPALAEEYPAHPVRLVVAYAAGGSGDLIARLLGQQLSQKLGQQILVDNRPGAGGVIGTDYAARAAPDGYTLYMAATAGPLTAGSLLGRKDYEWKHDFEPVSLAAVGYQVLVVSPNFPAKTLKEFVDLARKEPGKYNIASIGIGSAPHLAAELFQSKTGTKMVHVPFNGSSAQAITALIGGDVNAFIVGTSTVVPMIQAGQLRALAVTASQRIDSLPDVPTFGEQGLDFDYDLWFAVMTPRNTPAEVSQKLQNAIGEVVQDTAYRNALKSRGFDTRSAKAEDVQRLLDDDARLNLQVVERLGLK